MKKMKKKMMTNIDLKPSKLIMKMNNFHNYTRLSNRKILHEQYDNNQMMNIFFEYLPDLTGRYYDIDNDVYIYYVLDMKRYPNKRINDVIIYQMDALKDIGLYSKCKGLYLYIMNANNKEYVDEYTSIIHSISLKYRDMTIIRAEKDDDIHDEMEKYESSVVILTLNPYIEEKKILDMMMKYTVLNYNYYLEFFKKNEDKEIVSGFLKNDDTFWFNYKWIFKPVNKKNNDDKPLIQSPFLFRNDKKFNSIYDINVVHFVFSPSDQDIPNLKPRENQMKRHD